MDDLILAVFLLVFSKVFHLPFLEVANFISYPDLSVLQVSFIVIVFLAVLLSCDIDAAAGAYFFSMAEIIVSAILLCPSLDGCGSRFMLDKSEILNFTFYKFSFLNNIYKTIIE